MLYFRVKFYVADPSKLHEEYTRYVCDVLLYKMIDGFSVSSESISIFNRKLSCIMLCKRALYFSIYILPVRINIYKNYSSR